MNIRNYPTSKIEYTDYQTQENHSLYNKEGRRRSQSKIWRKTMSNFVKQNIHKNSTHTSINKHTHTQKETNRHSTAAHKQTQKQNTLNSKNRNKTQPNTLAIHPKNNSRPPSPLSFCLFFFLSFFLSVICGCLCYFL